MQKLEDNTKEKINMFERRAQKAASEFTVKNPDMTDGFRATNMSFEWAFLEGAKWAKQSLVIRRPGPNSNK